MAFIYESFSIQKVWTKGPLTLRQNNGSMSSFFMKTQQACKTLIWEDDPYKKMARRLANLGNICLFVWVFSLLLNIWGHITTLKLWYFDQNAVTQECMPQTHDMTPHHSIQTRGYPVAVLSIEMERHTGVHNYLFECLGEDPTVKSFLTFHTHQPKLKLWYRPQFLETS